MSSTPLSRVSTPAAAARPSPRAAGTRRPVRAAATIRDGDDDGASTASSTTRRSSLVASFALVMTGSSLGVPAPSSAADKVDMRALTKAFEEAMSAGADYDAADAAWTKAINIAPLNSAGWSNRGTKRLQAGRWRDARDDLERSVELASDPNNPDALTLNNLGNAEGALGNWDAAMANYLEASKDPSREMESIALANLALAKFQVNDVDGSLRVARNILRKDPEFWDVRALATAVLWADGREEDAEAEWQQLCRQADQHLRRG
jgi:tetratricopeptide (TPR) repeat protein